jgi:predicted component of type VI protein secretion system
VWQARQRLRRLEQEVAEARAAQVVLQQRVEMFERIAAAAGVSVVDAGPVQPAPSDPSAPPVPPTLLAAASEPGRDGSPVRLAVEGSDVIAVIGDEGGDPREWWAVIRRLGSGAS